MGDTRYHQVVSREFVDHSRQFLDRLANSDFPQHLLKVAGALSLTAATALQFVSSESAESVPSDTMVACEQSCTSIPQPSVLGEAVTIEAPVQQEATPIIPPAPNRIQNEPLRSRIEGRLEQVPTLQELGTLFPVHYADWQKQLDYIATLKQQSQVTSQDYQAFNFNDQFIGAFANSSAYNQRITPQLIVLHWTVHRYPAGLEGGLRFVHGLLNNVHGPLSSNYFIDHPGSTVYRYYDEDSRMTSGAKGMNLFAVNVEVEAGKPTEGAQAPSVIYDLQPGAIKKLVMTTVKLARRYNLAINKYTVLGHLSGDILFNNPTFNPAQRSVKTLRKFDVPQELVDVVIEEAQALDKQLG